MILLRHPFVWHISDLLHTSVANTIDSWFQDLQQYESTLDALATASLDQAFTDELNAIEQCKS